MKILASLAVLTASFSTTAASVPPAQMDNPAFREPVRPWPSLEHVEREKYCHDRIQKARAAAGKPELAPAPADPDNPLLMYAVDTRIDGCGVMVPVANPAAWRQSPLPGKPEVIPAAPDK